MTCTMRTVHFNAMSFRAANSCLWEFVGPLTVSFERTFRSTSSVAGVTALRAFVYRQIIVVFKITVKSSMKGK